MLQLRKRLAYWTWIILTSISGYVAVAQADTLYATSGSGLITLTWKGNVVNVLSSTIVANTGLEGSTNYLYILSTATQVGRFRATSYRYKINGVVIGNIDSVRNAINALNSGTIPSLKLFHTYRVVASLPTVQEPNTTYLVGTQDSILVANLNGDADEFYNIKFFLVNPGGNDLLTMRMNNVATNSYDYRYAYAGSTSTQVANNTGRIGLGSVQNGNTLNALDIDIYALTGTNRMVQFRQGSTQASQATVVLPLIGDGVWKNNSTNLTSLRFGSDTAGVIDFGAGTIIYVYKLM